MENKELEFEYINNKYTNLNGAKYYKVISEKMKEIHSKIPIQSFNVSNVAATDIREENFEGVNCKRLVMYLMSNGCEWALKSGNGCSMCGHIAKQTRKDELISTENYILQFKSEFNKYDFKNYPILNLYNNGSFMNDNEIPSEARREILKTISENENIKMVVIETRPEFVTEKKIIEIKKILRNKRVEIAMGLEVYEDKYRYTCLNKGFSLAQFEKASKIIVENVYLRTYVMLKPPFLTEKESIDEAIKTIKYAFSIGASTVSLETCTIQDYTLVNYLYSKKIYNTAWLWSILEVVKNTAHLGKVIVGLFQFYPSADKVPFNCEKCSNKVLDSIVDYNRTLDIKSFEDISCECKLEWEKNLKESEKDELEIRVIKSLL